MWWLNKVHSVSVSVGGGVGKSSSAECTAACHVAESRCDGVS